MIDAIKYKVSKLTSTIKAQYTPSEERKEYVCLRCGTEWTELDVLSLVSDEGFVCQNCGAILQSTEEVKGGEGIDRTGHEKNSKLMAQLDKMLNLLKQIDSVEIPPNDFDTAWDHKIDITRNLHTHPVRAAVATHPAKQDAVRGAYAKTDTSALEISLTSTEEKTAAEQAEEAARKAELERQNALPVWHTHSTVSTQAGNVDYIKREPVSGPGGVQVKPELKAEDEERKPAIDALDDRVAAYYAEMAKERALEAERDASSADEDDSDDFDEFEDVHGVSASESATPGAGWAAAPPTSNPTAGPPSATSSVKRELDTDSLSTSAPQTTTATPSTTTDDGPVPKRVKVEDETGPEIKQEAAPDVKEESDEDDEEFEDV